MARRARCLLLPPFHHRWMKVVNDDWAFARCRRCGREREFDDAFVKNIGQMPPPLYPSSGAGGQ